VEPRTGFNGSRVYKIPRDDIRAKMRDRGWLDKADDGQLSTTGRGEFKRARDDLEEQRLIVEENGLIWRIGKDTQRAQASAACANSRDEHERPQPKTADGFLIIGFEPSPCVHCGKAEGTVYLIRDPSQGVRAHPLHEACAEAWFSKAAARSNGPGREA
jgi:hypothetical protein